MANTMMTYVKIGGLNEDTHKKFVELFEKSNDEIIILIHYTEPSLSRLKTLKEIGCWKMLELNH